MIHRAKFQNFKALRDVEVTFDSRLTVLVGPNGSGKTSILEGIHYLSQFALGQRKQDLFRGPTLDELSYRSRRNSPNRPKITLEVEVRDSCVGWQLQVTGHYTTPEGGAWPPDD